MSVQIETSVPNVSVLISGWERSDNPFRRKIEDYGCTVFHMPEDANIVPKCDMAVLAIRSAAHGLTERVRKSYAEWSRPIVWAKAGFEPARADFEARLEEIRAEKAKHRRVIVRREEPCPKEKALAAEQRIAEREEPVVLNAVKVENVPTVEQIIRRGYANRQSPVLIADELNRLGFRGGRGAAYTPGTVSTLATKYGCSVKGKGAGKKNSGPTVNREELTTAILASPMNAETKISYIERVHRGELTSLIDTGAKGDDMHVILWRTPITEPARGVKLALSKAEACLVMDQLDAVRKLAEAEDEE